MKKIFYFLISVLCCISSVRLMAQERGDVLADSLLASYSSGQVANLYISAGLPPSVINVEYGIEEYKITYQTIDADGSPTFATGLLVLPVNPTCPLPLGVYNHGTFTDYASMPSNLGQEHMIGVSYATTGYVGVLPDLVGYGSSPGFPNYQHARSTGTANVDMLRAARLFCQQKGIDLNGQIFITGYSQGGHSAMAAHRELELYYANEFTVTACAPLSGAYDMSGTQTNFVFSDNHYEGNIYLGFIIMAFKEIYPDLLPWSFSEVFLPPYDTLLYNHLSAFNTPLGVLNSMLPTDPHDLMQPDLLEAFFADPNHPFRQVLRDNDVYDWAPSAPVQMGYCEGDSSIYYQNAILARNTFIANGSTNVEAVSRGAAFGHGECILPAILAAKNWFDSLKETCGQTGIEQSIASGEANLQVYPNPMAVNTTFMLNLPDKVMSKIDIYDMSGRLVKSFPRVNVQQYTINKDGLTPGIYLAQVTADRVYRVKLVVNE
ncbi:T9SS C-terminal target domain-containing protein [Sphingobacteriales bacterium UPWRP_1]|nr:hypothetical protein BVG80_05210 [Sphingobacteriales bacterium TSM_CSM]PSJ76269.1 T9SS C-terminal target domain-containing protein [Sphingobacteriales bacterium UPWRP_1]